MVDGLSTRSAYALLCIVPFIGKKQHEDLLT